MLQLSCDVSCRSYRSTIKLISNYFDDWKSVWVIFLRKNPQNSLVWQWAENLWHVRTKLWSTFSNSLIRFTIKHWWNCPLNTWPEAWGATVQTVQRGKAAVLGRQSFSTHQTFTSVFSHTSPIRNAAGPDVTAGVSTFFSSSSSASGNIFDWWIEETINRLTDWK